MSFQTYIINKSLEANKLPKIKEMYLGYLNKDYIKHGAIDIQQLIRIEQVNVSKDITVIQNNKEKKKTIDDLLMDEITIKSYIKKIQDDLSLPEEAFNKLYQWEGTRYTDYF